MAFPARVASPGAIAQINVTPLVDILLALLIIFMITTPVLTHTIPLDLPQRSAPTAQVAEPVRLAIDAAGGLHWNGIPVDRGQFDTQLTLAALQPIRPELVVRADPAASYQAVAGVLARARAHGLVRIGFDDR